MDIWTYYLAVFFCDCSCVKCWKIDHQELGDYHWVFRSNSIPSGNWTRHGDQFMSSIFHQFTSCFIRLFSFPFLFSCCLAVFLVWLRGPSYVFPCFVIRLMMPSLLVVYFLWIQLFLSSVTHSVFISVLWLNPLFSNFLMSVVHLSAKSCSYVQLPACRSNCDVQTPYACLLGILPDRSGYATISNENASLWS